MTGQTSGASILLMILLMSLLTMGSRVIGFFALKEPKRSLGRALSYLPFGLFGAIVVTGLPQNPGDDLPALVAALLVTALTAWRKWPIILSLVAGFASWALISAAV